MSSRRDFCRALLGLGYMGGCVGLGGCKIEPILDIGHVPNPMPPQWPELPPQIPDKLEDDEATLRALTEQFLAAEIALLSTGELRTRPSETPGTVAHLVELMRRFGVVPAGTRGSWTEPVVLDIVEPTDAELRVRLRPDSEPAMLIAEATRHAAPEQPPDQPDSEAPPGPGDAPPSETAPSDAPPSEAPPESIEAPPESIEAPPGDSPPGDAPPSEAPPESIGAPASRALDLAALGAFRQRGAAVPDTGRPPTPVLPYRSPLPTDELSGRIALLRAPDDLDLESPEAFAHVDALLSAVRDTGALGCLLLTNDDGPGIERFRAHWRRQVRLPGGAEQAMLIEGVLAAAARKPIEQALREGTWLLDFDLATRSLEVMTHNVLALVSGRDHPGQAIVLTCGWDTPDPEDTELDTARLLTTLAAFFQLAEWSRRSTPPKYSLLLLLTANAGFAAGTSVHAAWSANFGVEIKALLALDRPTRDAPEVLLAGRYDAGIVELARRAVAADGRELLLGDRLMPSLAPYLRYPAPVMTIGAPPAPELSDAAPPEEQAEIESRDPLEGLFTDVQMLRNLALALTSRR